MDILNTIADTRTVINAVNSRAKKNKMALVNLKIEIRDLEHLCSVMRKVSRISDVLEVHRVVPYNRSGVPGSRYMLGDLGVANRRG